jgi:hypothetical protein
LAIKPSTNGERRHDISLSIAMAIAVLVLNVFGDGLRDALDPKTSQR